MGYSKAYTCFVGSVEVLGGALLFFRRTTTLGALVSAAALLNVGVLDFCYQVPEKLDVIHLLLMATLLIAPDAGRLANMFLLNRPVKAGLPGGESPGRTRAGRAVVKTTVIAYIASTTVLTAVQLPKSYGRHSRLYGIYEVEDVEQDGEAVPTLATDSVRWRRVVFMDEASGWVEHMDESWQRYETQYSTDEKSITLTDRRRKIKDVVTYSQPDADHLVLRGKLGAGEAEVRLKKFDESKMLLLNSRFRWVNGYP